MRVLGGSLNFDELFSLKQFSDQLRERHVAALAFFHDQQSHGFRHTAAAKSKSELSMSSTATSIISLIETGAWQQTATRDWAQDYTWMNTQPFWVSREAYYAEELVRQEWSSAGLDPDNPFTVAFVVETCANLKAVDGLVELDKKKIQKVTSKNPNAETSLAAPATFDSILNNAASLLHQMLFDRSAQNRNPKGSISVLDYPPNAYLTQLVTRALAKYSNVFNHQICTEDELDCVASWAVNEIKSQIALITAGSRDGDALALAYAVICAVKYRSLTLKTPTEDELIRFAIKTFFDQQREDGIWPQSRPLFHYPTAGSAYSYEYELLAEFLRCDEIYDIFFQYIPHITRATYALDLTKFELAKGVYCWASNQRSQIVGPESWSTACVYHYLYRLDRFIAEAVRQTIARELEMPYQGVRTPGQAEFGKSFLDCRRSAADDESSSLKQTIFDSLVKPLQETKDLVDAGQKLPRSTKMSAILFGPPGTSKTEIVDQIAQYIGWPSVTVDPSYFVQNGLDAIQAQANKIFRMLAIAEQMVVLFDEFDEMVRNRADSHEILSRFLTTAMLPKLAQINKSRRILFIVATNYIKSFDIAIARPGRFDLIFQMMPPKAREKLAHPHWSKDLEWIGQVVGGDRKHFESNLGELTFLETAKLVERLKVDLGDEFARRNEELGKQIWREALESCTLRRPHEHGQGSAASDYLKKPADAASAPSVGQQAGATWGTVSEAEAKYQRLQ